MAKAGTKSIFLLILIGFVFSSKVIYATVSDVEVYQALKRKIRNSRPRPKPTSPPPKLDFESPVVKAALSYGAFVRRRAQVTGNKAQISMYAGRHLIPSILRLRTRLQTNAQFRTEFVNDVMRAAYDRQFLSFEQAIDFVYYLTPTLNFQSAQLDIIEALRQPEKYKLDGIRIREIVSILSRSAPYLTEASKYYLRRSMNSLANWAGGEENVLSGLIDEDLQQKWKHLRSLASPRVFGCSIRVREVFTRKATKDSQLNSNYRFPSDRL